MSKKYSLDHLDVTAFAKGNAVMEGQDPIAAFDRLAQEAQGAMEGMEVAWFAQGEHVAEVGGSGQLWLHLEADAQVPMICQRCLEVMPVELLVERSFRFVKDEATAEALDDEVEEDLLAISNDFNLRELLEDELLMDLPLVPMHDVCPEEVPMSVSDVEFEQASAQKPNPFAVLDKLRKEGD